jgi:hypothetical protein
MPTYPDVFDARVLEEQIGRIERLTPTTTALWGRMTAPAMLAHLNVSYEMVYESKHPRPNALMRLVLRWFVKEGVVGPKPYAKNLPTAPAFRIAGERDFAAEKARLIGYLRRVQQEGRATFEGRESLSFGPLTAAEWNVLFGKHLDHHLGQFGV